MEFNLKFITKHNPYCLPGGVQLTLHIKSFYEAPYCKHLTALLNALLSTFHSRTMMPCCYIYSSSFSHPAHLDSFKDKLKQMSALERHSKQIQFLTDLFMSGAERHCFPLCCSLVPFIKWKWGSVMRWNFMPLPAMWSLHQSTAINFFWYNCINAASNGWAYVSLWLLSLSDCVS